MAVEYPMIDWEKTSKETCITIIENLREENKQLKCKYDERAMAMRETGDMVHSIYRPTLRRITEVVKDCKLAPIHVVAKVQDELDKLAKITSF